MKTLIALGASLLTICQISFAGGVPTTPCNSQTTSVKEYTVTTQYDELEGQGFPIADAMTAVMSHVQCVDIVSDSGANVLDMQFVAQNSIQEPRVQMAIITSEGIPMSFDLTPYAKVNGQKINIRLQGNNVFGTVNPKLLSEIFSALDNQGVSVSFTINGFRNKVMFIKQ